LRCLECKRLTAEPRRGLCRGCYRDPEVRDCYDSARPGVWDARQLQDLIDMVQLGVPDKQIARKLGRTIWAIEKRRQRLGLKGRRDR
jgi:hypothetical protein